MKNKKFIFKKLLVSVFSFALCVVFLFSTINFTVISAAYLDSYDLRDYGAVTEVKNQGSANTCWAFAAVGAIESSLIKGGYADKNIDLSEAHLGWFSINTAISQKDDLTYGDGYSPIANTFQYGGNDLYVIWSIARGFGLELEEFVKYDLENINSQKVRENERYVSEYNVKEINIFEKTEINNIKKSITENGALMASYIDNASYYTYSKDGYCYFENYSTKTNHAILIVGWDDNFSKDNFGNVKPSKNGAWLCRNSRGTSWGNDGYFWLSYETASLKRIVSFGAEPSQDDIYQIYQYDGYGFSKSLSIDDSGVVYTSNIFDVTENGILAKVAFYTTAPSLNHEIYIYSLKNGYSSPTDGELLTKFDYYSPYTGYYLVDLPKPINLLAEQSFSVVIKAKGEGRIKFYAEGINDRTSQNGKSFASADGVTWADTAQSNCGNLCIKAWINPEVYENPDIKEISQLLKPVSLEYSEDNTLKNLLLECNTLISKGGTEREILNNYLRLLCLYEKYFGYVTIENEEQFLVFSNLVNSGNDFYDTVIVLTNDVDFSHMEYIPPSGFNGIFNGKNHIISGIDYYDSFGAGVFGYLNSKSIIKNLRVKDCTFSSDRYTGGISYWNSGFISDCSVDAEVHSDYDFSGAIAGYNNGVIENCTFINPNPKSNETTVTENHGIIKNCLINNASNIYEGTISNQVYTFNFDNDILIIKGINIPIKVAQILVGVSGGTENNLKNLKTNMEIGSYKIALIGDVSSDGVLDSTDYLKIKSYFLNLISLNPCELKAADTNCDGEIGTTDYLLIKSHFLGKINIYGAN